MDTWGFIILSCVFLHVSKSTLKNVKEKKEIKEEKVINYKHIKKQVSQRQTLPVLILSEWLPSLDFLGSSAS